MGQYLMKPWGHKESDIWILKATAEFLHLAAFHSTPTLAQQFHMEILNKSIFSKPKNYFPP